MFVLISLTLLSQLCTTQLGYLTVTETGNINCRYQSETSLKVTACCFQFNNSIACDQRPTNELACLFNQNITESKQKCLLNGWRLCDLNEAKSLCLQIPSGCLRSNDEIWTSTECSLTKSPSNIPTDNPTQYPSNNPTQAPLIQTNNPTDSPSSNNPSNVPSYNPTINPSLNPSIHLTNYPTNIPSIIPTNYPTNTVTKNPTKNSISTVESTFTNYSTYAPKNSSSKKSSSNLLPIIIIVSTIASVCICILMLGIAYLINKNRATTTKNVSNITHEMGNFEFNNQTNDGFGNPNSKNHSENSPELVTSDLIEIKNKNNNASNNNINLTNEQFKIVYNNRQGEKSYIPNSEIKATNELYDFGINNKQKNDIDESGSSNEDMYNKQTNDNSTKITAGGDSKNVILSDIKINKMNNNEGELIDFKQINNWDNNDVIIWLNNIVQLSQYDNIFKSHDINGKVLFMLNEQRLNQMGIKSMGHKLTIIKCINDIKNYQN